MEYAAITAVLLCDEERAEIVLSAKTVQSVNAHARLWQVVSRLITDIENEIREAPGAIHVVRRYMSASPDGIQSTPNVGARRNEVQLHKEYPVFQVSVKDPVARELKKHKIAVANAQAFIKLPLANVLSTENGERVTEQEAEDIAMQIEDDSSVSELSFLLRVREAEVESSGVHSKAFAVINKWRQSSSNACISVLRDVLHQVGLQEVDESVFGHIQDQTLTKLQAGASALSLPGIPDAEAETGMSPHRSVGGEYGWLVIPMLLH